MESSVLEDLTSCAELEAAVPRRPVEFSEVDAEEEAGKAATALFPPFGGRDDRAQVESRFVEGTAHITLETLETLAKHEDAEDGDSRKLSAECIFSRTEHEDLVVMRLVTGDSVNR